MTITEPIENGYEFISFQAFDDQYIDRQEEKRILEIEVKNISKSIEKVVPYSGSSLTKRTWLLREINARIRLKSFLKKRLLMEKLIKRNLKMRWHCSKRLPEGKVTGLEIKKRLKGMMEENGWKDKEESLFGTKWYSAIRVRQTFFSTRKHLTGLVSKPTFHEPKSEFQN